MRSSSRRRKIIDTVGKKGVLLLGRFNEGRIAVLERFGGASEQVQRAKTLQVVQPL